MLMPHRSRESTLRQHSQMPWKLSCASVNGDNVEGRGDLKSIPSRESKGLSLWLAAVFIVGEMAGSGVLALPKAFADTGWSGAVVLAVCCVNALYCGICLGKSWMILEERWEEYQVKVRQPYSSIAYRAVGRRMMYVSSVCMTFSLLGVATVFLLLCSQLVGDLAYTKLGVSFCYWVLIISAILCPLMWLGTPDDFWPAAVLALVTTIIACIALIVSIIDDKNHVPKPHFKSAELEPFFLAFGTMLFAFGGASAFPTFQNDMKDRQKFPLAAIIAFIVLFILYLPVSAIGYAVYGSNVSDNIISSLSSHQETASTLVKILLAVHVFFAFLIAINPATLEIEEFLRVPDRFGWKRCLVRTGIMAMIMFIALSVPRFSKILNLIGGSTVTLVTFVFPSIFYIMLCNQKNPSWPDRSIPLYEKVYLIEIIIIGIIGGIISTYSAFDAIVAPSAFTSPCYVNITAASFQ